MSEFIDAHIHLEDSLVTPTNLAETDTPSRGDLLLLTLMRLQMSWGTDGNQYMLQATEGLPIDIAFMLTSCIPATP